MNKEPIQSLSVHHTYPANVCKNNFNTQLKINNNENTNKRSLFERFLLSNFFIIAFPKRKGKKHQMAKKYSTKT